MFELVAFSLRKAQKCVLLPGNWRLDTMRPSNVDIVQPPLTTIHVPVAEMGRQAAQVFLEQVKDCSGAKTTRVLSPSLVVRASTARVAGD